MLRLLKELWGYLRIWQKGQWGNPDRDVLIIDVQVSVCVDELVYGWILFGTLCFPMDGLG
jgi:hypothetical protein